MRHHYLSDNLSGDHWAVGSDTGLRFCVLVQVQGNGEQVRVALSPEQAEHMAAELLRQAQLVRNAHTQG